MLQVTNIALWLYVAVATICYLYFRRPKRIYPPGPPGLPFIGMSKPISMNETWKTYADWGQKYGDKGIMSFNVLGRKIVVLNSIEAVTELFTKRSLIYSDRPFTTMGRIMKREKSMVSISNNETFRVYRRLLQQSFNPTAVQTYWNVGLRESLILVDNLAKAPERYMDHVDRMSGAVILKVTYGYTVTGENDHFINLTTEGIRIAVVVSRPGWVVDSIPILRFLPEWFPGADFKRQARLRKADLDKKESIPHEWVKRNMAKGTFVPSFTSRLLDPEETDTSHPEHEEHVRWTASALFAAAADTTSSAIAGFIFLMMLHPDVQKRAQREVDTIVAKENRLPTLSARSFMPYLECVFKEVLRWITPSPLALPHCTAKDDIYQGYFIPAKTTVVSNIWAITHDSSIYPNPDEFDPERYNNDKPQRDPTSIVFGFGRRNCPGQYMAESNIFMQMMMILAVINIEKPIDEYGKVIEPEVAFNGYLVRHVKPFKCSITVRSPDRLAMIQQDLSATQDHNGDVDIEY